MLCLIEFLSLIALVKKSFQYFFSAIATCDDLKVWQKCDRFGNSYWQVYNPKTRHFTCFGSESEVRSWLEQQFYHY